ncbi:hypothetical protein ASE86_02220 [Sphingomonas sp. Leaf33]|uniref:hypothetical protein n=1 Tax=Sphingomonas sp. Leaf33 TaxID=1736215 RepID=UPI0006F4F80D|nr:hypothetical protein [Sphingomonas sp. Leaf33]KQN25098.1 hypothetical protein ASE86_02220 [Sphingomonas sp. Leaf33]
MLPTLSLLLALGFVAVAACRFFPSAPSWTRTARLVLALAAGLAGAATFGILGDSRWLVGGILFFGAAVPGFLAGHRRSLAIAALVCGVLGLGLYGIATLRPMEAVAVAD